MSSVFPSPLNFQQGSISDDVQIAVVLGVAPCLNTPCPTPGEDGVGTVLLRSLFDPEDDPSTPELGLHQTFTVTPPASQPTGLSVLSLTHLQMVGVSRSPPPTKNIHRLTRFRFVCCQGSQSGDYWHCCERRVIVPECCECGRDESTNTFVCVPIVLTGMKRVCLSTR